MVKYFVPRKQVRFTVFTQDKINSNDDASQYATGPRYRRFVFKLSSSEQLNGTKCKIAVESVKCRDLDAVLTDANTDHDSVAQPGAGNSSGTQKMLLLGNSDEKEIYTVRANFINTSQNLDTRPQEFKTGGIIYNGSLNFNNTNPLLAYCYDVSPNILNDEIVLYFDSNWVTLNAQNIPVEHEKGIKIALQVAITFILWDGDEVEAVDGFRPDFNTLDISNRDRV